MSATMQINVVSIEEELYSGMANSVFIPASAGEIGVFPGHMALLSTLKPGEVRIETEKGEESIYVAGGMVEVQPHIVTIFSDTAIRAKDLNEAAALEAKQKAEELIKDATSNQDLTSLQITLTESLAKLQIIKNRNKK